MTAPAVRPARQAGRFYPRDPRELKAAVQAMLDRAEEADLPSPPRGLLAPHAGYDYSGPTAARAYKQAARHPWERVVLFAPSHSAHFIGGSIFQGEACATPLGLVPLDSDLIRSLMSHRDVFRFLPKPTRANMLTKCNCRFSRPPSGGRSGWFPC